MAFEHVSVLLHETVDGLNVKPDGIYVDATLGGGGHAYEVCTKLGEQGRLIGIDQDADAIKAAGKRLEGFGASAAGFHLHNRKQIVHIVRDSVFLCILFYRRLMFQNFCG